MSNIIELHPGEPEEPEAYNSLGILHSDPVLWFEFSAAMNEYYETQEHKDLAKMAGNPREMIFFGFLAGYAACSLRRTTRKPS
jgi:hypothetical protein